MKSPHLDYRWPAYPLSETSFRVMSNTDIRADSGWGSNQVVLTMEFDGYLSYVTKHSSCANQDGVINYGYFDLSPLEIAWLP